VIELFGDAPALEKRSRPVLNRSRGGAKTNRYSAVTSLPLGTRSICTSRRRSDLNQAEGPPAAARCGPVTQQVACGATASRGRSRAAARCDVAARSLGSTAVAAEPNKPGAAGRGCRADEQPVSQQRFCLQHFCVRALLLAALLLAAAASWPELQHR